jgi:hypothetical protein
MGTAPHAALQFDVSLTLLHPALFRNWSAVPVVEAALAPQGIRGLIGRNILAECLFLYDGPASRFILGF